MTFNPKRCESCGTDISFRDVRAKFCFPCIDKRQKRCTAKYNKFNPKHKRHQVAREITRNAVALGFLPDPKSLICVDCGKPAVCYDHRNYNHPLKVEPVCIICNSCRGKGIPMKESSISRLQAQ